MDRETALNSLIDKIAVPVVHNRIYAGNIRTHYLTAGSGQPLILLHGAGAGGVAWSPVFESLSRDNWVIAPDIAGYGESEKPRVAYDRSFYSEWLNDFLQVIDVTSACLVGHSQGGAIALHYSLEYPEHVDRLILVDSAGFGMKICLGALIGVIWMNTCPSKVACWWASRYVLHSPACVDEELITYRLEVAKMPGGRRSFWHGSGKVNAVFSPEQLARVSQPTLVMWGEEDRFFPVEHALSACRMIPQAQLHVVPDAGHCPFLEKPEEFSEVVVRFVNGGSSVLASPLMS